MITFQGIATGVGRKIGLWLFLAGLVVIPAAAGIIAESIDTGAPLDFTAGYVFFVGLLAGLVTMLIGVIVWALAPVPDSVSGEPQKHDP